MGIYKITNVATGQCLTVSGSETAVFANNRNVVLANDNNSVSQKWVINSLSTAGFVRAALNTKFGLNIYRAGSPYNCDIYPVIGNESDAIVTFAFESGNGYRIKLTTGGIEYHLTASGENAIWTAGKGNDYQLWTVINQKTNYASNILSIPSGHTCNWNQYHSDVMNAVGSDQCCTLVAGLDAANYYAMPNTSYQPSHMSAYWGETGYSWGVPGLGACMPYFVTFDVDNDIDQEEARLFIKTQIDLGRPPLVSVGTDAKNNTHTVFCYGYQNFAASDSDIMVCDPANITEPNSRAGRLDTLAGAMTYSGTPRIRNVRPTYSA